MKMIVGLGNPGKQYENTRHNAGFMALDEIAKEWQISFGVSKFKALSATYRVGTEQVLLLKPQTYMNLSGEAVRMAADYFQIAPQDILVIYDDKDIEVGMIRLRPKGSAGGQNGMKNIILHLQSDAFPRIRIGIGSNGRMNMADYVLSPIDKKSCDDFKRTLTQASNAAIESITRRFTDVMTKYNTKPKTDE